LIIGSGPAGITAAIYAARKRLKYAMVYKDIGGEVAKTTYIENYTGFQNVSGEELTKIFENHMKMFKPEIIEDEVLGVEKKSDQESNQKSNQKSTHFVVKTKSKELEAKTLLIATGAMPKSLNIPGEKEYASKGVSWCATCDAPLFLDQEVAVIGAGNTGLTSVLQLLDIAKKVYLINKNPAPKADKIMVEKAKMNPKFELINEAMIQKIDGDKFVSSITIRLKEGQLKTLPVTGVFINIGYQSNTKCLNGLVELDEFGQIIIDDHNMTSVPGIFAAGDVTNMPHKQIIIAAGHGANAVISIYDYLAGLEHHN
jgi:alkyl hydroperoxide reductase subunit F